jgi:hypothetical protein
MFLNSAGNPEPVTGAEAGDQLPVSVHSNTVGCPNAAIDPCQICALAAETLASKIPITKHVLLIFDPTNVIMRSPEKILPSLLHDNRRTNCLQ